MSKAKRSYYLPDKLIKVLDKECERNGYVREKVVAAAVGHFLKASPTDRHTMFTDLDEFLNKRNK